MLEKSSVQTGLLRLPGLGGAIRVGRHSPQVRVAAAITTQIEACLPARLSSG